MEQGSGRRHPASVQVRRHEIRALDGYALAARTYSAGATARAVLVMAGATGVPQGFYRSFADHAAGGGFDVVTFDYRGIAGSAPATLRGFRMDYRDWGRLDLAGVLEQVGTGGRPVHLIGHSFGGQALGLVPDPGMVRSLHAYGTGSGWHGWMPPLERARVRLLWSAVAPLFVRAHGYLAWSRLGMGEDLPLDVYRQWKYWCRFPEYWFDDPQEGDRMRALFARVTAPITAVNSVDDPWIPPTSRDAFFRGYARAPLTTRDLRPEQIGRTHIGHMGYFRRGSERLWDELLDRLSVTP